MPTDVPQGYTAAEVAERFQLAEVSLLEPDYNIAPTQPVAAVRSTSAGRESALFRWGATQEQGRELSPFEEEDRHLRCDYKRLLPERHMPQMNGR
jgi:putative SOS response-associated peptidase YedK